jgi:radical SAM superfamily enzyme YgiQ (UPF0313 family)
MILLAEKAAGGHNSTAAFPHFHFEARAELITEGQAKRLAELDASVQIGLQTSNPQAAALLDRGWDRKKFLQGVNLLNRYGVSFGLDLIYGLPGDTLSGFKKSLDFALSLYPTNLDIFRLSLLPGTTLYERRKELGLKARTEAPYLVESTPGFTPQAMEEAENLAKYTDLFYNKGRAVAWFIQVLRPLNLMPAHFIIEFSHYIKKSAKKALDMSNKELESLQLAFLRQCYNRAGKAIVLPAVEDLVHYHSAWGRALAEGESSILHLHYKPAAILSEEALDIETFVKTHRQHPAAYRLDNAGLKPA